ncbi:MAG: DUF192 domain-containing protein [Arenicellales bacterium]|nr:DUF192 domain-containing protein [Arenicellales bacterium]
MRKDLLVAVCLLLTSISAFSPFAFAQSCSKTTPELIKMEVRDAHLIGPDLQRVTLKVRVADTGSKRAAGFQYICPEVAEHTSILFLFAQSHIPNFHMNNVYMPLDIAFIDKDGRIRDIQTMNPVVLGKKNQPRLWSPKTPVSAALEVKGGLFEQLGVTADEWSVTLSNGN